MRNTRAQGPIDPQNGLPGAEVVARVLGGLGVATVFGVPGTQNMDLLEAIRVRGLRFVVPTHELAAAFMAHGYARTRGEVGVLIVIPGPGITYAVSAIAEARHDSAALLVITTAPRRIPGTSFGLQDIDQMSLLQPIVKAFVQVSEGSELATAIIDAYVLAGRGEPGPVAVEIAPELLLQCARDRDRSSRAMMPMKVDGLDTAAVLGLGERIKHAERPLLFLGQGAAGGAQSAQGIAERLGCPVVTTCSGRGIISEDHPLVLVFDQGRGGPALLNELLARSDLVLAVGCKWTHNGCFGYQMRIPPSKLVRVDASAEVVNSNYPADTVIVSDAPALLEGLDSALGEAGVGIGQWCTSEIDAVRVRLAEQRENRATQDPRIGGALGQPVATFFREMQALLPRDTRLVTDSGLHQFLTRTYCKVHVPRGMLAPVDFQSMGFGLPAAIGAKLGSPSSEVVAIIGDGGFLMSGMELMTAIHERVALTVAVFVDGRYGLIRSHQLGRYGRATGDEVMLPDLAGFAAAAGALYYRYRTGDPGALREFLGRKGVRLLEVPLGASLATRTNTVGHAATGLLRRRLGSRRIGWLKAMVRKFKG